MELRSIKSQGSLPVATETIADSYSHDGITDLEFSETSNKAFVSHNNTFETTSTTAATFGNSDIVATSEPIIKSNKFSIEKSSCICLAFVVAFVLSILLIPIIVYITLLPQEPSFLNNVDFQSCSVNTDSHEALKSDTTLVQVCEVEGNQIHDYSCGNISAIRALQVVYALGIQLMNDQCTEDALPFFCTAIESLCMGNTSTSLNEECIYVRDNRCSTEWRVIENLFNISLPSCDSFKNGTNVIFSNAPIQKCPDLFEVFCGSLCLPSCQQVSLFRDGVDTAFRVWITILYAINVIGGIITIIASIVYRQKMLRYPLIFIVYSTLTLQVNEFFLILPTILGSNDLLCSDANMLVAINDSTVFCQIQGFVTQASLIMFMGFWIAHLLHMFYSIAFPLRAYRFMKSDSATRRVHFIEVFIIITLGLLNSTLSISITGYIFVGFPRVCTLATLSDYFFSQLIPFTIGGSIGMLILCSLVVTVRNRKHVNSSRKSLFTKFSAAEAKLFIVFLFYGVTTFLYLCSFYTSLYFNENIRSRVADYVTCSVGGDKLECHILKERLYDVTTAPLIVDWISITVGQFVSIVNLNFVIQYSDVKKMIGYLFSSLRHNS